MKKITALVLALALSLTACGVNNGVTTRPAILGLISGARGREELPYRSAEVWRRSFC